MNANDARELQRQGSTVRRVGWPEYLYLTPEDPIPPEDEEETDWVEVTFVELQEILNAAQTHHDDLQVPPPQAAPTEPAAPQVAQPQPTLTRTNSMNVQVAVKKTKPLDIKGLFAGRDAELVLVKSITCSDPASALPLNGDFPAIIGIKPAENLTVAVKGVVKSPAGEAYECEAVSNLFDVVAEEVEMMPVLDENGQPKQATNPDGSLMTDPVTGQPMIEMVPATAGLTVVVQE